MPARFLAEKTPTCTVLFTSIYCTVNFAVHLSALSHKNKGIRNRWAADMRILVLDSCIALSGP